MAPRTVPPSFLCPISLEIMKDPVTLCTGHTYDRVNILKWLQAGNHTCPVTMLPLHDTSLIPNVVARRLIQAWCSDNGWKRSFKAENVLRSNPAFVRDCVLSFLKDIARGQQVISAVEGLKLIAKNNEINRACIVSTGGPLLLISLLWVNATDTVHEECEACEDALYTLALICKTSMETRMLILEPQKLSWIAWHLQHGCRGAKVSACALLKTVMKHDDACESVGRTQGVFKGLVSFLGEDELEPKVERLVLKVLKRACQCRVNRLRVIEAGFLRAVIDILKTGRKTTSDRALGILEVICSTKEGKDSASRFPGLIPALIDSMMRISPSITEHVVSCLLELCPVLKVEALHIALDTGMYRQLLIVLQSDVSYRAKCKAQVLLKWLHSLAGCGS